ncbi:MAG: hypothetical protein U0Y82_07565 [Thermoleophilia bacterium]
MSASAAGVGPVPPRTPAVTADPQRQAPDELRGRRTRQADAAVRGERDRGERRVDDPARFGGAVDPTGTAGGRLDAFA